MMKIRLAIRDGGYVAEVSIPSFKSMPDVVVWGQRFFSLYNILDHPDDPCSAEYREVFAFYVAPHEAIPAPSEM